MDETARIDRVTIIEDTLDEILGILERASSDAEVRGLLMHADKFRRIVEHWKTVRPDAAQVGAMHEVISELHADALRFARSVSGIALSVDQMSVDQRPTVPQMPVARRK